MISKQFSLLNKKRFLPLFIAQFTSAFHDNLFKNALVVLMLFGIGSFTVVDSKLMVTYAAALFIFPFVIFSAFGAELANRFDKAKVILFLKVIEILIGGIGAFSLYVESVTASFFTLFLLGAHAAIFGPSKYSYLPEALYEKELISGNALLNTGTFLAILLGTIGGTSFASIPTYGILIVLGLSVLCTIIGGISSFYIPSLPHTPSHTKISFHVIKQTHHALSTLFKKPQSIVLPVLGVSWFYFLGGMFLSQMPNYIKEILVADAQVLTFFLTVFSIGIAFGGILNNILTKGRIEATYVPLSALGVSIFSTDLYFASKSLEPLGTSLQTLFMFLSVPSNWRIVFDVTFLSIMCGLFVVPLISLVQHRTSKHERPQILASGAIMDALFIILSSLISALLIKMGLNINELFLVFSIANLFFAIYVCVLIPDYLFKSILQIVLKFVYKIEIKGLENIEKAGPRAVIVGNHSSFLDAPLLAAFLPGRPMFAVYTEIAKSMWIRPFLKLIDAFAIDPTNPFALKALIAKVQQDRHVVIFPEGRLTTTGALMKIYEGPGVVAERADATILPVRIDGVQHTPFARLKGKVTSKFFPKITITFLPPYRQEVPTSLKGRERREFIGRQLYDVMERMIFTTNDRELTLFEALIAAQNKNGSSSIVVEDIERVPLTYKNLVRRSILLGKKIAIQTESKENVGVLLPNGSGIVTVFFALQAIGRVPSMLNYSVGPQAVMSACKTAQIKTIYTSRRFIELAKLQDLINHLKDVAHIIYLEDMRKTISVFDKISTLFTSPLNFHNKFSVNPNNPAVLLFTSGSEGTPKGVVLSHQNLMSNTIQLLCRVDFNQQDIIFNALPLFHSFGLTGGMLLPVLNGVKTFLYPSPLHYRIVPEIVYSINATIMFGTDTFLQGYARMANSYDFYRMRYIFAGAEKVKEETRRIYMERFGVRILEGYGTTETSPVIAVNSSMYIKPGSVGRFLTGIDYRLEPVPGVEEGGRLFVRGPNIMLGYYLSSEPGILQPPNGGWHDTGDIVRVDAQGFAFILGRAKRFAKIAGEMVSLSAVEAMIQNVWNDFQHAVVSIPDALKGEQLVLVTTHPQPERSALSAFAKQNGISALSVPVNILIVEKLPVLGTGKTDYVSLQDHVLENIASPL